MRFTGSFPVLVTIFAYRTALAAPGHHALGTSPGQPTAGSAGSRDVDARYALLERRADGVAQAKPDFRTRLSNTGAEEFGRQEGGLDPAMKCASQRAIKGDMTVKEGGTVETQKNKGGSLWFKELDDTETAVVVADAESDGGSFGIRSGPEPNLKQGGVDGVFAGLYEAVKARKAGMAKPWVLVALPPVNDLDAEPESHKAALAGLVRKLAFMVPQTSYLIRPRDHHYAQAHKRLWLKEGKQVCAGMWPYGPKNGVAGGAAGGAAGAAAATEETAAGRDHDSSSDEQPQPKRQKTGPAPAESSGSSRRGGLSVQELLGP